MASKKSPSNGFGMIMAGDEQQAKIDELRKLLGPVPERLSDFCSDASVLRYLRARNWHVKKATKMLKETLKWRSSYKPELIHWEDIAFEAQTGKIYRSNCMDKQGRPVLVMTPSLENSQSTKGRIRYLVYCMENAIQNLSSNQEQMVWMINFRDYRLSHVSLRISQETARILQGHYPERLGIAILYNPPKFFEPFYKAVKPILDPKTRDKVRFVYSNDPNSMKILEELFDMEQLEATLGGKKHWVYNYEAYAKMMSQDDAKRVSSLQASSSDGGFHECSAFPISDSSESERTEGFEDESIDGNSSAYVSESETGDHAPLGSGSGESKADHNKAV